MTVSRPTTGGTMVVTKEAIALFLIALILFLIFLFGVDVIH